MDWILFIVYILIIVTISLFMLNRYFHDKKCSRLMIYIVGILLLPGTTICSNYYFCIFFSLVFKPFSNPNLLHLSQQGSLLNWAIFLTSAISGVIIVNLICMVFLQAYRSATKLSLVLLINILMALGVSFTKIFYEGMTPQNEENWRWGASIIAASLFIIEIYVLFALKERSRRRTELLLLQNTVACRYESYQNLEETIENTNAWMRDVSNHIITLKQLNDPDLQPVIKYCEDVLGNVTATEKDSITGMPILDRTLLGYGEEIRKDHKIAILDSDVLSDSGIPEYVFVSLFAQLWDIFFKEYVSSSPMIIRKKEDEVVVTTSLDATKKYVTRMIDKDLVFQAVLNNQDGQVDVVSRQEGRGVDVIITLMRHPSEHKIWQISFHRSNRRGRNSR